MTSNIPLLGKSVIGWDWDGTLSILSGDFILPVALDCMKKFTELYHVGNIIISGRELMPLEIVQKNYPFITSVEVKGTESKHINPYRWKMAKLRQWWDYGRGPLILYVDNDYNFVQTIRSQGELIPVSTSENFDITRLESWIKFYKTQRVNRKS